MADGRGSAEQRYPFSLIFNLAVRDGSFGYEEAAASHTFPFSDYVFLHFDQEKLIYSLFSVFEVQITDLSFCESMNYP